MRRLLSLFAVGLMAAACGGIGSINLQSLPPINLQSLPPFVLPSGITGNGGDCPFVTPAEVASIMGSAPTISNYSDGDCSFTFSNLGTVVVTTESADLASSKAGLGQSAKDITVGGLPGVSGTVPFINQPIVYVQLGDQQLQVLGVLLPNDEPTINKLVQVATIAASHAGT